MFRDVGPNEATFAERLRPLTFEWPMRHDGASLRALFASFSDWSTLPEPDRSRALDDIAAIVDDQFGGVIDRRYLTVLYIARRR